MNKRNFFELLKNGKRSTTTLVSSFFVLVESISLLILTESS